MDIVMSRMNGDDATRAVRSAGILIPIVAVTSNHAAWDMVNFVASGFSGVVPKPVSLESLARGVVHALE
jgi:CheY-like chemotaxis protein